MSHCNPQVEVTRMTRRHFFGQGAQGLGLAALACLLRADGFASPGTASPGAQGLRNLTHLAPKAKRVIYLFQSGGPSQMDLFDYKPDMDKEFDKDLPDSIRMGQRITTMTSGQKRFPVAPSKFKFKQHGQGGAWVSELLPYTASISDNLCFVKSMVTDAI